MTRHPRAMTDEEACNPPAMSHGALFLRFLRFGATAFGGPVVQIAMIRRELVDEERWISGPRFNRLLAVMQALPGPEAHELCVHLGMRAKGRAGGLLAGLGFMLPGLLLMLLAAWAWFRFEIDRSWAAPALVGAQAAVVALIVRAVHRIGGHILVDRSLWIIGLTAAAAALADAPFWIILPAGAAIQVLASTGRRGAAAILLALAVVALGFWIAFGDAAGPARPMAVVAAGGDADPLALFVAGLKGGLLTFGGAYTAIPFLRQDLVGRGWVSDSDFLDGVALANVLPAPLIIFATFAGYAAGGFTGALAITAGVFLPAFAFSLIFYDRLEAVVADSRIRAALDGAAAGVVGVIGATVLGLAQLLWSPGEPLWPLAAAAVALLVLYVFKSRYAAPAVLLAAAAVGLLMGAV
ncbi:MAG TPA: chromate efflux transporter [Brevundimonas sp.]|nr:chromate efflux transporter [Brevundimonas sp.]